MKVFLLALAIFVLGISNGGWVLGGAEAEEGGKEWIEGLGSSEFAVRVRAEKALRGAGRDAVAALREATKSDDPQVRLSAQRILDHILILPENIPTKFRSLIPGDRKAYQEATEKWRGGVKMAASNTDGRAGTSGNFAQSFVPECKEISAVEVCTYPLTGGHGWLRLDLCRDEGGGPSKSVLGRSWVYAPKGHGFPHGGYIVHEFDDVVVEPGELMWMVYAGFPDADCGQNLINYGLSFQKDDYPAGKLWRVSGGAPKGDEDVKFRILEEAAPHPRYREATADDRSSFPPPAKAHALWDALLGGELRARK